MPLSFWRKSPHLNSQCHWAASFKRWLVASWFMIQLRSRLLPGQSITDQSITFHFSNLKELRSVIKRKIKKEIKKLKKIWQLQTLLVMCEAWLNGIPFNMAQVTEESRVDSTAK